VKELLKSDSICQSYAQIKRVQLFLLTVYINLTNKSFFRSKARQSKGIAEITPVCPKKQFGAAELMLMNNGVCVRYWEREANVLQWFNTFSPTT